MGKGGATFDAAETGTAPLGATHDPQWRRCERAIGRAEKTETRSKPTSKTRGLPLYLLHLAVHCALLRFAIGKSCSVALRAAFPLM